jgi:hypothetical protein
VRPSFSRVRPSRAEPKAVVTEPIQSSGVRSVAGVPRSAAIRSPPR